MGFYDGQGLTTRASAWELADTLDLPVLLVVQPGGASVTLAAEIQGLVHFCKNSFGSRGRSCAEAHAPENSEAWLEKSCLANCMRWSF